MGYQAVREERREVFGHTRSFLSSPSVSDERFCCCKYGVNAEVPPIFFILCWIRSIIGWVEKNKKLVFQVGLAGKDVYSYDIFLKKSVFKSINVKTCPRLKISKNTGLPYFYLKILILTQNVIHKSRRYWWNTYFLFYSFISGSIVFKKNWNNYFKKWKIQYLTNCCCLKK